jgi:hypothetical protein
MAAYTTIDDGTAHFNIVDYTGNGTAIGSGGQTVTGVGFQPDITWVKSKNTTDYHNVYDSARGVTIRSYTNTYAVEDTNAETLTSWNADGFVCGSSGNINGSGNEIHAWNWKESAGAGISAVIYTGNSSADTTITTGFQPEYTLIECRDVARHWRNYHWKNSPPTSLNFDTYYNQTQADTLTSFAATGFVLGADSTDWGVNNSPDTYFAYSFKGVQGFSKFGGFTSVGAGGSNPNRKGAFIYTGFTPKYLWWKSTSISSEWSCHDLELDTGGNPLQDVLYFNKDVAELSSDGRSCDFLSNGFKMTGGDFAAGATFIYGAFAEVPLANSEGVPATAR